mgnify:CR=1 FL=1
MSGFNWDKLTASSKGIPKIAVADVSVVVIVSPDLSK